MTIQTDQVKYHLKSRSVVSDRPLTSSGIFNDSNFLDLGAVMAGGHQA